MLARILVLALAACILAPGQNLIQRTRLGNVTEDLAYITDAPYKGQIAILDGYAVYTLPENAQSGTAVHKLFSTRNIPMATGGRANGITYVPGKKYFLLGDYGQGPDGFVVKSIPKVDLHGNYLGALALIYGPGMLWPSHVEGLDAIAEDSPNYPGLVLRAATFEDPEVPGSLESWIDVVDPDSGAVVHQIRFTDPAMAADNIAGVTYLGPGRILVSFYGDLIDKLAVVDFGGNRIGGYIQNSLHGYPEGLKKLPGGLVAGAALNEGILWFFDPVTLQFLPKMDLKFPFGIGVDGTLRSAWSGDLESYLILHRPSFPPPVLRSWISSVPWTMRSQTKLVDLLAVNPSLRNPQGVAPMHGEGRFALTHGQTAGPPFVPRSLQLFSNSGTYEGQIDLTSITGRGNPTRVRYVPPEQLFAIRYGGKSWLLTLVNKAGAIAGEVDFGLRPPIGADPGEIVGSFAYFEETPGGPGRWLVWALDNLTGDSRVFVAGRDGAVIEQRPFAEVQKKLQGVMSLGDLDYINSGPHKGAFCAKDAEDLFVFRWR